MIIKTSPSKGFETILDLEGRAGCLFGLLESQFFKINISIDPLRIGLGCLKKLQTIITELSANPLDLRSQFKFLGISPLTVHMELNSIQKNNRLCAPNNSIRYKTARNLHRSPSF